MASVETLAAGGVGDRALAFGNPRHHRPQFLADLLDRVREARLLQLPEAGAPILDARRGGRALAPLDDLRQQRRHLRGVRRPPFRFDRHEPLDQDRQLGRVVRDPLRRVGSG